jgi:hypothetical protein
VKGKLSHSVFKWRNIFFMNNRPIPLNEETCVSFGRTPSELEDGVSSTMHLVEN